MRVVAPLLAMKVYRWIAASGIASLIGWLALAILALKALVPGPGLDQRPVHREVIGGKQLTGARLLQYLLEESIGHFALQQTLTILGKYRHVPHCLVHIEPHEPAIKNVVVQLLHQLPLTADRV